ncbi:unnamed protein product [Hermetia illucens]|uniref:Uncharacterized protein n=1 Tax=Hermetia illucens TaxID=343691 RepID=A0A7R8V0M4_HERIL|nr:unnamed protein product [Hermetia illucens]
MNLENSNVITIQHCDLVAAPITESGVLNEAKWTLPEAEFHDQHVQREMSVSSLFYWVIRSNDDRHFSYAGLSYDSLVIIMGRSVINWHAMKQGDDSGCLSGSVMIPFGRSGILYDRLYEASDAVKQFEAILDLIRPSMFEQYAVNEFFSD